MIKYRVGHIVLLSYALSFIVFFSSYFLTKFFLKDTKLFVFNLIWLQVLSYFTTLFVLKRRYNLLTYQICARAHFLGYVLSFGILIYFNLPLPWKLFGVYAGILSTFHLTEFLAIAYTNPAAVSVDTFVINHSTAYTIAAISSWIEFIIESFLFPDMKCFWIVSLIGVILCGIGELFRKTAIFTAQRNFNHVIQSEKASDHTLVKHGVYNLCRHPSYVGWFYWSIGTQLILQNPVCFVIYAISSWKFFKDRIFKEEMTLIMFFGNEYLEYQRDVGTGLPFITGYSNYKSDG